MAKLRLKDSKISFDFPIEPSVINNVSSDRDNKVVIIGIVGKTDALSYGFKALELEQLLGKNVFYPSKLEPLIPDKSLGIQGYYDPISHTVLLNLLSFGDTVCLQSLLSAKENEIIKKGFLSVWSELKCGFAKSLLFLFSICHILIFFHPTCCFDITYISLFRTLDIVRQKIISPLVDALKGIPGISRDWLSHGRFCSPRVLFFFNSCSPELKLKSSSKEENITNLENTSSKYVTQKHPVKKLEHALEDQIYRILRKSRVITNMSANSLFAIPVNNEFVYINTTVESAPCEITTMLQNLISLCQPLDSKADFSLHTQLSTQCSIAPLRSINNEEQCKAWSYKNKEEHKGFKSFLKQHIDLAFSKGFDDNVGRHSGLILFEAANRLYEFFFLDKWDRDFLNNLMDIDRRFSKNRCSKVLPLAIAAYQENLPSRYTKEYHLSKLGHAIAMFSFHARGTAADSYILQLKDECERYWRNGHQVCETLSLTGNHCTNSLHRLRTNDDNESEEKRNLPEMPHCSGIKYISTCNCGHKQASRDDPFDVKIANFEFYEHLADSCCRGLKTILFPIFKPSVKDFKAAEMPVEGEIEQVKNKCYQSSQDIPLDSQCLSFSKYYKSTVKLNSNLDESAVSNIFLHEGADNLSPPTSHVEELSSQDVDEKEGSTEETTNSLHSSDSLKNGTELEQKEIEMLNQISVKETIAQPSTTEYLPGMLHSECPAGLLPQFSSWSLLCLGPSSLYSHSSGIHDQPGFLNGTNFLLPWDVIIKVENKEKWPAIAESMGKKGMYLKHKKDLSEFNIKIFIGMEYECPRGHRFMCSSNEKVLKAGTNGLIKENALKIINNDMPLYFSCPCRNTNPWIAQLMRIHIVTPKAPVHITLLPKVQPAPSPCPIFLTGFQEPLKLSQSTYWILRFPFAYVGPEGPYLPPKDEDPRQFGRLLKSTFGITDIILEKT